VAPLALELFDFDTPNLNDRPSSEFYLQVQFSQIPLKKKIIKKAPEVRYINSPVQRTRRVNQTSVLGAHF